MDTYNNSGQKVLSKLNAGKEPLQLLFSRSFFAEALNVEVVICVDVTPMWIQLRNGIRKLSATSAMGTLDHTLVLCRSMHGSHSESTHL